MLTDHWVIAQLISQFCALGLLLGASYHSLVFIRKWAASSGTEGQLLLERRTYLVATIVQYVLFFQLISLLIFLFTVNQHLPGLIKGAMCATGTLGLNPYGYPVLYLKMGGVLVYTAYLFLHHLDDQEPEYPLTPLKYWFVLPALLMVATDFVLMVLYFINIQPDIIATCCSVAFLTVAQKGFFGTGQAINPQLFNGLFVGSFFALSFSLWVAKKSTWLHFLIGAAFIASAAASLKYFFVKYIYGLPSHLCLFDIFFGQYYYIGFAIFVSYYLVIVGLLANGLLTSFAKKLKKSHADLQRTIRWGVGIAALMAFAIPIIYWWSWPGTL